MNIATLYDLMQSPATKELMLELFKQSKGQLTAEQLRARLAAIIASNNLILKMCDEFINSQK